MSEAGYEMDGELLVTAIPEAGYDVTAFSVPGAPPTVVLDEGDVIDLGDRAFEVLHLPGHSPGSIGLWDADSGVLFSGDAVYDGPLLDEIPGADLAAYVRTMEMLHDLPVEVVHAGHDPSFGRERLRELTRAYLDKRRPSLAPEGGGRGVVGGGGGECFDVRVRVRRRDVQLQPCGERVGRERPGQPLQGAGSPNSIWGPARAVPVVVAGGDVAARAAGRRRRMRGRRPAPRSRRRRPRRAPRPGSRERRQRSQYWITWSSMYSPSSIRSSPSNVIRPRSAPSPPARRRWRGPR